MVAQNKEQIRMKLFQIIQDNFAFVGISSNQPYWNAESAKTLFIFSLFTALGAMFLFFKANTFLEYTMNIYVTTAVLGTGISFLAMLHRKETLFELIDRLEEFVDESELKTFYSFFVVMMDFGDIKKSSESIDPASAAAFKETNRLVKRSCEIGHFVLVKVSPTCTVLPQAIISYVIYWTTNAGSEAFGLPFLFW